MPASRRSRKARRIEAEDRTRAPHRHLGRHSLEPLASVDGLAGATEILVDHDDEALWPSQLCGALGQAELALGARPVLDHLRRRRLSRIDERGALTMVRLNLVTPRHRALP